MDSGGVKTCNTQTLSGCGMKRVWANNFRTFRPQGASYISRAMAPPGVVIGRERQDMTVMRSGLWPVSMTAFNSLGGAVYFDALYFDACLDKSTVIRSSGRS